MNQENPPDRPDINQELRLIVDKLQALQLEANQLQQRRSAVLHRLEGLRPPVLVALASPAAQTAPTTQRTRTVRLGLNDFRRSLQVGDRVSFGSTVTTVGGEGVILSFTPGRDPFCRIQRTTGVFRGTQLHWKPRTVTLLLEEQDD